MVNESWKSGRGAGLLPEPPERSEGGNRHFCSTFSPYPRHSCAMILTPQNVVFRGKWNLAPQTGNPLFTSSYVLAGQNDDFASFWAVRGRGGLRGWFLLDSRAQESRTPRESAQQKIPSATRGKARNRNPRSPPEDRPGPDAHKAETPRVRTYEQLVGK